MKQVLLFGSGKSSTYLIDHLLSFAGAEGYELTVVDQDHGAVEAKVRQSPYGHAQSFNIADAVARKEAISKASIVISLLPPTLHFTIAQDCLRFGKHLLTASYADEQLKKLAPEVEAKGLLFLCEMGLDPGLDHMSAKRVIDGIHGAGGAITSFLSHCGGLVAPESDTNPWHYKISWNPRNVVMAGKAGAIFRKDGEIKELPYESLFSEMRYTQLPEREAYCWYPNRDSLSYMNFYGLQDCPTFIRTTLRHPDFIYGWKNLIDLNLTNEDLLYDTDGLTLAGFFKEHFDRNGFNEWLEQKLREQFEGAKDLLSNLVNLVSLEQQAAEKGIENMEEFMMVDDQGDLKEVDIDDLKINAATTLADRMHHASLTLKQLFFLGLDDTETEINKGKCSAADVLQFALEKKLALEAEDKDLVVMLHEISFNKEGGSYKLLSSLVVTGEDGKHTAMAKTVGLPLGIAARMVMSGTIQEKGLKIPIEPAIYEPVLKALKQYGIEFAEHMSVENTH